MVRLVADEGNVYTNGETYGKEIFLPPNADQSVWRQIDESEIPGEPTSEDRDAALRRFGVEV